MQRNLSSSSQLEVIYGNLANHFCKFENYVNRIKQLQHGEMSFMPLSSDNGQK